VVFDASPERRREALHNQALRGDMMRGHAQAIADEVDRMVAGWAGEGSGSPGEPGRADHGEPGGRRAARARRP
jgi:hypothetical protein